MRLLLAILLLLFVAPASAQQGQGMSQARVVSSCGGEAAPSGAITNLTMDTTGRLCQSGIGSNVCPQAAAYLARTVGGNEGGNAVNITALICGLVTDGVITGDLLTGKCGSHLDALYVFAQQNQIDALLNLCGTNYTATAGLAAVFTSYVGFGPFNTSGGWVINTNFNAATATSPNFTQNSANFGFWSYANTSENNAEIGNGATGATGESQIYSNFPGGLFYARVNNGSIGSVPVPGAKGLFVGDRSSSSSVVPYWDGVAQATQTGASSAPLNAVFTIGAVNGASTQTISEAHIGGSLGPTLNLALYNRLNAYMTAMANIGSVWNSPDAAANGMTLTNGGLTVTNPAPASYATVRGTVSRTAGKYYVEFKTPTGLVIAGSNDVMVGLADTSFTPTAGTYLGHVNYSVGCDNSGATFVSSGFTSIYSLTVTPVANDVLAIAVDLTAGKFWVAYNNAWIGGGDPASGTNPAGTIVAPALGLALFPGFTAQGVNGGSWTLQAAAASQKYVAPSGFKAWDAP